MDDLVLRARAERARWIKDVAARGRRWVAATPFGRALRAWSRRSGWQAEVRELIALDERTLRDIGLRREDLVALASGRTTLEQLNAERYGGARGALVELRSRERRRTGAPVPLERAA